MHLTVERDEKERNKRKREREWTCPADCTVGTGEWLLLSCIWMVVVAAVSCLLLQADWLPGFPLPISATRTTRATPAPVNLTLPPPFLSFFLSFSLSVFRPSMQQKQQSTHSLTMHMLYPFASLSLSFFLLSLSLWSRINPTAPATERDASFHFYSNVTFHSPILKSTFHRQNEFALTPFAK